MSASMAAATSGEVSTSDGSAAIPISFNASGHLGGGRDALLVTNIGRAPRAAASISTSTTCGITRPPR